MEVLTAKEFKEKVFDYEKNNTWKFDGEIPVIVDFYADWCGPCKALGPIMEQLSKEYSGKVNIYKVDTEASPDLASLFAIRSIPSILFIPKEGKPTMAAGLMPKESLKQAIKDVLNVN